MVTFIDTYLYKLHRLTNSLDKLFDRALLQFAGCSLSQLTLLLSVQQIEDSNQRVIASLLEITPAAVSRQVKIAVSEGHIAIKVPSTNRRAQKLALTPKGRSLIVKALAVLEEHVFKIFESENAHTTLSSHLEMLYLNSKEALCDITEPSKI